MKKRRIIIALAAVIAVAGIAYAAFSDAAKVTGSSFKVGSSDLKFLADISQGTDSANLVDSLEGPAFTNISPSWKQDYPLKLYNDGTATLDITSHAKYSTANDTGDIRSYINVELFDWNDENSNGVVDDEELGQSYGKKSIIKWSSDGFSLGSIPIGEEKAFVLRFTSENIPDTKQGMSAVYDFEFDAINE
jgi:hypothetical protein